MIHVRDLTNLYKLRALVEYESIGTKHDSDLEINKKRYYSYRTRSRLDTFLYIF